MADSKAVLTQGPVTKTLAIMTAHMLVGHISMGIFNLTDTYFVSKLGTVQLAAMSFTFPVVMFAFGIMFGLGIGTSAILSKAVGEGDLYRAKRLTTDALLLTFFLGLILSLIGQLTIERILIGMGAEGESLTLSLKYLRLWLLAFPIAVLPMVGNNAIRATGDTRTPAIIMSTSALLNLVLDPIMIFGLLGVPAMGIVGAALATVLARFLSVIAALSIINFRLKLLDLSRPKFLQTLKSWGHIFHIGLPASATSVLTPVSMGIITNLVAEYGDPAVAAVGAGGRVEFLAMILVMSLGSVLLPFTGQNLGAKEFSRIRQARQVSHRFAMIWGLLMFLVVGALAGPISSVFSKDPTVLGHMKNFLRIIPLSYGFNGVMALSCLMLNGLHRPIQSAMMTLIRTVILLVPLSWIGGKLWGVNGLFIGMAMANVISGILAKITLAADFKKILHAESGSPAPSGM